MKKSVCQGGIGLILLLFSLCTNAQQLSSKEEKKLAKANEYASKEEYSKAIEILEPILNDHESSNALWDQMVQLRLAEYKKMDKVQMKLTTPTITVKGGDANLQDSMNQRLQSIISQLSPGKMYYGLFLKSCRKAQCLSEYPEYASMYLRKIFVDANTDTNINEKAQKFYEKAETSFGEKNYSEAIKYYKKAIEVQPDFYRARLYLGDAYYSLKDYRNAITYYKEACTTAPNEVEPRKYLVDALARFNKEQEAFDECVKGILVYPDVKFMWGLEELAVPLEKKYDRHWIPRHADVNTIDTEKSAIKLNRVDEVTDGPWKYYQEAKEKVKDYCDANGIIKDNPVTKERYLEVYSWKYMLEKTDDPAFSYAKEMRDKNLLDCYVFVSLYHIDVYRQYKDLVTRNPNKVKDYISSLFKDK